MAGPMRARFTMGDADSPCASEKARIFLWSFMHEKNMASSHGRIGYDRYAAPDGRQNNLQLVAGWPKSLRNTCHVFASYLSTRPLAFCTAVRVGRCPNQAAVHFAAADRCAARSRRRSG